MSGIRLRRKAGFGFAYKRNNVGEAKVVMLRSSEHWYDEIIPCKAATVRRVEGIATSR